MKGMPRPSGMMSAMGTPPRPEVTTWHVTAVELSAARFTARTRSSYMRPGAGCSVLPKNISVCEEGTAPAATSEYFGVPPSGLDISLYS